MFDITDDDLTVVYEELKDLYNLTWTNTAAVKEGFTIDCPILIGKAHGQIMELYVCDGMFVLDVMDSERTQGIHWHPDDVFSAVNDIAQFMEGKSDYRLFPLRKSPSRKK